jgi:hypothetical protein
MINKFEKRSVEDFPKEKTVNGQYKKKKILEVEKLRRKFPTDFFKSWTPKNY